METVRYVPTENEVAGCRKLMMGIQESASVCQAVSLRSLRTIPQHANLGKPMRRHAEAAVQTVHTVQNRCPVYSRLPAQKRRCMPCRAVANEIKSFLGKT